MEDTNPVRGDAGATPEAGPADGQGVAIAVAVECTFELNGAQKQDWDAFLDSASHCHPRQSPEFARVEAAVGRKPLFAIGRRDGRIVAVGLFSLVPSRWIPGRHAMAMALSGPVCDDAAILADFLQGVAQSPAFRRVDAMAITPYWLNETAVDLARRLQAAGWRPSEPESERSTGIIDISLPDAELIASFSRSARRKLKAEEMQGVVVRPITEEAEADLFYDQLNARVQAAHSLSPISRAEQRAGFKPIYCNPRLGILLGAFKEGRFLAGFLVMRSAKVVFARRYVADTDQAQARIAPTIWLECMRWARGQGCTGMDVEGYQVIEDTSHPDYGRYEYKRQLSLVMAQRIVEHTLVLHPVPHALNQLPRQTRRFVRDRFPALAQALRPR